MASSDPVLWQLALCIQAQLETIQVANGYFTDIGSNVIVEDAQTDITSLLASGTPLPVVVDVNKTVRASSSEKGINPRQRSAEFTVEAAVVASIANAKQLSHQILADIESALDKQAPFAITGVRMAKGTTSEILKRPDGLNAVIVQIKGTANYLPPGS